MKLFGQLCLFSPVAGRITWKGQPLAGVWVEQQWRWRWQRASVRLPTDASGCFAFPGVQEKSWSAWLRPHDPRVQQIIRVEHQGRCYEIWHHDKDNYHAYGENGICRPWRLDVELSLLRWTPATPVMSSGTPAADPAVSGTTP